MTRIRVAWMTLALVLVSSASFAQGGETVVYFHADAIGSTRLVTDANGVVVETHDYLPFGEPWASSGLETRRFGGKERDTETGLDYFGARYYASANGRFATVDPVLDTEAAIFQPQRWNRYTYAANNPFRYIDPDGRELRLAYVPNTYADKFMQMAGSIRDTIGSALGASSPGPHSAAGDFGRSMIDSLLAGVLPRNVTEAMRVSADSMATFGVPLGAGGRFVGTTLTEAKTLVGAWGKGTFSTLSETIAYHFEKHGGEVGAQNILQYMRKAFEFSRNLKGATKHLLEDGAIRYEKSGRYIIKDSEGNILSYGLIE